MTEIISKTIVSNCTVKLMKTDQDSFYSILISGENMSKYDNYKLPIEETVAGITEKYSRKTTAKCKRCQESSSEKYIMSVYNLREASPLTYSMQPLCKSCVEELVDIRDEALEKFSSELSAELL